MSRKYEAIMKKINLVLFLLLTFILSAAVSAQRRPDIDDRMKKMDKDLDLSDKQYSEIKSILEDQQKKVMKLREEADGDRKMMRERAMKMMSETEDRICKVLTEDQQKKFRKNLEERRKNRRGERPPR
jgi:Spy/CpxP family protein refolding chaperone